MDDGVLGDVGDQELLPLGFGLDQGLAERGLQAPGVRVRTAGATVDHLGPSGLHHQLLRIHVDLELLPRPWKTRKTGQQRSLLPCPLLAV